MLTDLDLSAAIDTYERNTRISIEQAKKISLPKALTLSFSTMELTEEKVALHAQEVPTGGSKADSNTEFIYVFRQSTSDKVSAKSIANAFEVAKKQQDSTTKKNLCKLNGFSTDSKALYVGRSKKPRERLKSHLRIGNSGTYAIHFAKWASALDLRVEFHLYKFSDADDRVIQIIEDGLWDHLKPMLGRRGER